MALQNALGLIMWPRPPQSISGTIGLTTTTYVLDANGEKGALVFRAPKAGNIVGFDFRTGTVTTGDTIDLRLETINSSGDPSGTLAGVNGNASHVLDNGDDDAWITGTAFTAAVAVTLGQPLAMVIVNGAAGNFQIAHLADSGQQNYPYGDHFTSVWTKIAAFPILAPRYDDGSYGHIHFAWPASAVGGTNVNTGTTPDELGNLIEVPFKCRVVGAWVWPVGTTAADFEAVLYDTDGSTELAKTSYNADDQAAAGGAAGPTFLRFEETATLTAGGVYRLVVKPSSATNVQVQYMDVASVAVMGALPGGADIHSTQRTDAGAWSQTTTRRQMCGVLIDQLDDGAAGSGTLFPVIGGGGPVV